MYKPMILLVALAGLTACATTPPDEAAAARLAAGQKQQPVSCMKTGTRIELKDDECAATSGRAYSKDQIDQTGAFSVSEALQKLDPSLAR